jgi:hypothetical protein
MSVQAVSGDGSGRRSNMVEAGRSRSADVVSPVDTGDVPVGKIGCLVPARFMVGNLRPSSRS